MKISHKEYGIALLACSLLVPAASAQLLEPAEGGWYVSGFVGAAFPDDITNVPFLDTDAGAFVPGGIDLDNDVFFGGAVGARLPFKSFGIIHTRAELEVSYFESDISLEFDDLNAAIGNQLISPASESLDTLFILANSYADFIWREDQPIIPYIGGGLGAAVVDFGFGTETDFTGTFAAGLTVPYGKWDFYAESRYYTIYNSGPNLDGFTTTAGIRFNF